MVQIKKSWKLITAATLSLSLVIALPWVALGTDSTGCDDTASGFAGGDGSANDPYLVANATQLQLVASTGPSIWACSFEQTADITLPAPSGTPLRNMAEPIGRFDVDNWTQPQGFEGSYNGGGHSISNFYMEGESYVSADAPKDAAMGLFGYTLNATLENIALVNPSLKQLESINNGHLISDEKKGVAALVGRLGRNSEIYDVSISGASLIGHYQVAVLVGRSDDHISIDTVSITNSSISTPVGLTKDARYLAPIVGYTDRDSSVRNVHVSGFQMDVDTTSDVKQVSAFMVRCRSEMHVRHSSTLDFSISISTSDIAEEVAGFIAGDSRVDEACTFSDTQTQGSIQIDADLRIYAVGGFANSTEEVSMLRNSVDVEIDLDSETSASRVGGFIGNSETGYSHFSSENLVDADITISAPEVAQVGLYTGHGQYSLTDSIVQGSISVTGTTLSAISNLVGYSKNHDEYPQLKELTRVIVKAQPLNLNGGSLEPASGDDESGGYFIGLREGGVTKLTSNRCLFWSSTTDPGKTDAMGIGSPASNAQLGRLSFLESCGFDTERIWTVSNGQPSLLALGRSGRTGGSPGESRTIGAQVANNFKIKVTASEGSVRRYQLDLGRAQSGTKVHLVIRKAGSKQLVSNLSGGKVFTIGSNGEATFTSREPLALGDRLVVRKVKAGKTFGGKRLALLNVR